MARTDELLAKAAKDVKATFKGFKGVFKTLTEQHGQVYAMLKRATNNEDRRFELWPKIRTELLSHERAELSVVYPVLRGYEDTRAFAEQHEQEAGELEAKIGEIDATLDPSMLDLRFQELLELVENHVSLEEGTIFPAAMKALGDDRAEALDREFLVAKRTGGAIA